MAGRSSGNDGWYGTNDRGAGRRNSGRYQDTGRSAQGRYSDEGQYVQNRSLDEGRYQQLRYPNEGRYSQNGYPDARYAQNRYADDRYYAQSNYPREPGYAEAGSYSGRKRRNENPGKEKRNKSSDKRYKDMNYEMRGRSTAADRKKNAQKQKNRRKRNRARFLLFLFLLAAVCAAAFFFLQQEDSPISQILERTKSESAVPETSITLDSLDSPYAIMLDAQNGTVIGSKRGDEMIYPASMTKIMTVFTAIEHIENLDQTITMSYDYYDTLYAQDASRAGFEPGEEAKIRDLLYGALLPSGAECCMELSIQAAGSEADFADLMNQKAQELGLTQTHFVNCTGLHSEEQYSTPHEIGKILQAALKNKTFREVFTTHYYSVAPTNVHPDGFTFWSTMFKNMNAENVIGGEIKGGKTGYTQAAGYCLASMAEVEGREYIQVTAGWAENPRVQQYHINDAFIGYNMLGRTIAETQE